MFSDGDQKDGVSSRLSGLSPFAGEDDLDTLQNVKQCDWEFDEDAFAHVSQEARDFIRALLVKQPQYVECQMWTLGLGGTSDICSVYIKLDEEHCPLSGRG